MTYQALRLQLAGPIARIVLARPDAANRVDDRLLRELAEATAAIAEAEGVVLALLEAEGADFCRGWGGGGVGRAHQEGVAGTSRSE